MTISITNIPVNPVQIGVALSPAISFSGATANGTVRIQDTTSGYDSGAVAYTGTSGTVPFTPTGTHGPHSLTLTFSGDGVHSYTIATVYTILTTAVPVNPAVLYVGTNTTVVPVTTNNGDGSGPGLGAGFSISPPLPSYLPSPYFLFTGQISGTPTSTYNAIHTITVSDIYGQVSTQSFTLSIVNHVPVTHDINTSVPYNSVSFPIGLNIDYPYTSVAIGYPGAHGVPTVSGNTITYTPTPGWDGTDYFTYTATGPGGTSNPPSTVNVTISTDNVKIIPSISSGYLARGITSIPITPITFSASGGQAPYTITPTGGSLPTGLNFASGTISGTPNTAGYFNFALTTQDSSSPTRLSTVTNYSINVLSLGDVSNIATKATSSKYSKTSEYWNKTPLTVTPRAEWDQWGLYRSYIGSNSVGWGSDSIQNTNGTVDIPYSGVNVDVVIIAAGSPDPSHPEFAVNPDGTGGSRVKYYNWLADRGGQYSDNGYRTRNANAAAAMASIVAGNTYGWARNANIYSLDTSLMPYDLFDYNKLVSSFNAVAKFHSTKLPNPVTGLQNPTIVICNQLLSYASFTATNITSVTFRGTQHLASSEPGGVFSTATLAAYNINSPFTSLSTSTSYRKDTKVLATNSIVNAAVQNCIKLPGLVFVSGAGDYQNYIDTSTGPDYNDTLTAPSMGTIYYSRGGSPSVMGITVGAVDSTAIEQIATYSATGPGVDIYAPGTNVMAAFNSDIGVNNVYYPDIAIPTTPDPRNSLYAIGKVSGTAYAAAQVAGVLACLAQVKPDITQDSARSYLINNAGVNQLTTGTTTAGTSVQLYASNSSAKYANFLNSYGVWPNSDLASPINSVPIEVDLFLTSPTTGTYTLIVSADNELRVYLNGSTTAAITTVDSYYSPGSVSTTVTLNKGINTLKCIALNYSNGYTVGLLGAINNSKNTIQGSFGVVIQDRYGNHIFETSANLPVALAPNSTTPVSNLYLFGKFPTITETATSVLPAVTTNQPFSISINGGVPNSAFYVKGTDVITNTYNLGSGTVNNNFTGNFTLTNQVFTTPGIKTYDFYFANSTDRVSLSVEVLPHDATKVISSYTQSGKLWNKTHDYIPVEGDWLNWGLLRSSTTTNAINWGSDSVVNNTTGTVTVPYSGLNVDIVIIDSASVNPDHPEFALYSDGTGGSRVKYYNWLTGTGTYPTSDDYSTTDANRVAAIAGIAAGNTYGWARAANIYSINYTLIPPSHVGFGTPPFHPEAFNVVTAFHNAKVADPVTGYKRPTVVIAGWALGANVIPSGLAHYQGTDYYPVSQSDFNQYGLIEPYADLGIDTSLYVNVRDPVLDAAVTAATNAGIIVVSTPGDVSAYCAKDNTDPNWNNYFVHELPTKYYYHQGASPGAAPGVICVGALDSDVEQYKALYSGNGPRVDLFAPGSDLMSAMSNSLGVINPKLNSNSTTIPDNRNGNFYVGKASGTAFAAANVAGYLACLLQVYPTLTPTAALNTVTQYSSMNQLTINIEGYGANRDLNGANNLLLYSVFPEYNEEIVATVYNSTVTSVALGEYFNIVITNGDPFSYFTYSGSKQGRGQLDANGSATINDFAVANLGEYVYKFYFPLTNHSFILKFKVTQAGDVSSSNIIHAGDFDRLQNRVNYLMHDIYGTPPFSSAVTTTNIVTATSWTNLYKDIESAYIHQNNSSIDLLTVNTTTRVTSKEVNSLTRVIDNLINNFDKVDSQQLVVADTLTITTATNNIYDSYIRTYHWTTSTEFPNVARNFFNLGGYIEVNFENPLLGNQIGQFTLTDYISGSASISLPIPGGNVVSKFSVQSINGNTATIDTIVAPNVGNTALATGTVKLYVSTGTTGGIAGPLPSSTIDAPLAQGQLVVNPISQYITLTGNDTVAYPFTMRNTSPTDIIVSEINVINDTIFAPLQTTINSTLPIVIPAHSISTATISFQNVTPGTQAGLYNNVIQLMSDGPNPVLNVAVPILTKFGIVADSLSLVVTRATTATIIPVAYAGTITTFSGVIQTPATGFQLINPGANNTYFTLDDTPGKLTMGILLLKEFFSGLRFPSTTGALKSPYADPVLVVDVASIPNKTTSTQITYTAYSGGNVGTYTSTVSVTPNVEDRHLGSWISPQNYPNGVIGFSYDIINGERCLTYGFGMGGGGSLQLFGSDSAYAYQSSGPVGFGIYSMYAISQLSNKFQTALTTSSAFAAAGAWNTGSWVSHNTTTVWNTTTEILRYSPKQLISMATDNTTTNAFLQTYGIWNGYNSSATTFVNTTTFLVRDSGEYTYYLNFNALGSNIKGSAKFTIDGTLIDTTSTTNVKIGTVPLTAGLHSITINSTQSGTVLGSVALAITDYRNQTVWSTLEIPPPTWAEIGRIKLIEDGKPHTYQLQPNTYSYNVAKGTSYATYFKNESIVTVNANEYGQLNISLNPVVASARYSIVDATLSNVPYLFYYASNAENQVTNNKRFNNYQTVGQYVRYFTGFDPQGKVTTKNVLAPGYIAPPTIITDYYSGPANDERPLWETVLIDLAEFALIGFAIYAVWFFGGILITGSVVTGAVVATFFTWDAFINFVAVVADVCFTGDTEVTMANGTIKKIKDVKAGEFVYNHNKTKLNRVKYVEVTVNKELIGLYSPDKNIAPFATLNHPLYVNGKLSSLHPEKVYCAYPWLGLTTKIDAERSGPLQPNELMYNLYLDGDNTYIVNGYGTNSIIGDGGALRVAMENGYLIQDRVQEMFQEYIDEGTEVAFGGYLFNKYFGKVLETIKLKFVVKLAARAFDQPKDSKFRKMANKVFKFIGIQAIKRQLKQLKK